MNVDEYSTQVEKACIVCKGPLPEQSGRGKRRQLCSEKCQTIRMREKTKQYRKDHPEKAREYQRNVMAKYPDRRAKYQNKMKQRKEILYYFAGQGKAIGSIVDLGFAAPTESEVKRVEEIVAQFGTE